MVIVLRVLEVLVPLGRSREPGSFDSSSVRNVFYSAIYIVVSIVPDVFPTPSSQRVPHYLLLASISLSTGGFVAGPTAVFIIHRVSPLRFFEVCPSCDFSLWLLDINEACGLEIGYNRLTRLNLGHDDFPLCPFLGYRARVSESRRVSSYISSVLGFGKIC